MSLAIAPVRSVLVRDPVTMLKNERQYAVLKSGSQISWKAYLSPSVSNSSIQFTCPPPSSRHIVNRKVYLCLPVTLTFTGVGNPLLVSGNDAPRAFGASSSIDTLQATLNNTQVSINMADIIQTLLRFNTDAKLRELEYSLTPTCQDQSQQYSDLHGSIRSSLSNYLDANDEGVQGNGSFPFNIVSNGNGSAVVDILFVEPLFMSPFYFGKKNSGGFYGLTTMDFTFNFIGNANRFWSHDPTSAPGNSITSISYSFQSVSTSLPVTAPQLLFQYITPQEADFFPHDMPLVYPYFTIQRFPTSFNGTINAGASATVVSNNIELSSIPRRIYVFARRSNNDYYGSATGVTYTDTYFRLTNLSVQFGNQVGLFSSATPLDLYKMSVKNHCNLSFTQWYGGPVQSATLGTTFGTVGSIICIEPGSDIGLGSLDAPGKIQNIMLQIQATATNISSSNITNPTFYIVVVNEGTFTIMNGSCTAQIGVLSSGDILNAQSTVGIDYHMVEEVNGGDFWSGLKDFGSKIWEGLKMISPAVKEVLPQFVPQAGPIIHKIDPLLKAVGLGEGEGEGVMAGVMAGAKRAHKKKLKHRLMY